MTQQPIVSICLPCYGRVEYVRKTLRSIYVDNQDVSLDDYEVVISDNDPKQAIHSLLFEFNYPNIHYHYTECEGFMNSYHVLTYAKGKFLKLHNSQVTFRKGVLAELIKEVKANMDRKSLIFYTNGLLYKNKSERYKNFDDFFYALSYWPSWSNGFSIWKDDFDKIGTVSFNKLFPHTSLFITQHNKREYIVNDHHWFDTQRVKGRSGHNKFEAFTIEFPSLVDECYQNHWLSLTTKKHILHDIVVEYLPTLLFNKYIARIENYEITGYKDNIKRYFPKGAYCMTWICIALVPFKMIHRKIYCKLLMNNSGGQNEVSEVVVGIATEATPCEERRVA